MTTTKISQLTASVGVTNTDLFLTVVSGAGGFASRRATGAQLSQFITSSITSLNLTSLTANTISGKLNGFASSVSTISSSAMLSAEQHVILADAAAGNITLTLPDATAAANVQFAIKKIDSTANSVTVSTSNGQTIDGVSTKVITTQYEAIIFVSNGINWFIF